MFGPRTPVLQKGRQKESFSGFQSQLKFPASWTRGRRVLNLQISNYDQCVNVKKEERKHVRFFDGLCSLWPPASF